MGAACTMTIEAQLASGVWTNLTADTHASSGLRLAYGITGNKPQDCVAGVGTLDFVLNNCATAGGRVQGYYSPAHASKRAGWTYGITVRAIFATGSTAAVTSITRASSTATVTTGAAHGRATGDYVTMSGAVQTDYNGTFQITVTGGSTFTYTVANAPATPATGTILWIQAFVKFRGKIADILPDAGQYLSQRVGVVVNDSMADLLDADVRELTLQVNQTEAQLVSAILDVLPTAAQPYARSINTGVDTFPWAFDDLGGGVKAITVIQDVVFSSLGQYFSKGDGTHCYRSRHTRATGTSAYTFTNTMHGLKVPSSIGGAYNRVRATIHQKVVSAAATDELYTMPTGSSLEIAAGATINPFTDYSDPNDRQTRVGGSAVVTALVAGTHYAANSQADGGGSSMTASITASLSAFASTGKWTLTNTAATTAYITLLKVIGKAVRDPGPQTFESYVAKDYGDRPLDMDLRYQDDTYIGSSAAVYVRSQYDDLTQQMDEIAFIANDSSALMVQALTREPGDRITITEAVTGLSVVDGFIQRVELDVTAGPWIVCRWGLAPASPFALWQWGVVGSSEWGTTTVYGF